MANLTEKEIEDIVEKVTERVIENVYTSVGKSVVTKFFWFIVVAEIGVVTYLDCVGHIKVG